MNVNENMIEAQAHYLIEDRIHPTHRVKPGNVRRRHRRVRRLSWL
jgi:hypothetical protein